MSGAAAGARDIEEILASLPHRWPFVLVDRITAIEPGVRAIGLKCVSMNEPWFAGHFPSHPVMPGVLVLEALAQVAGVLASVTAERDGGPASDARWLLLSIDKARFRRSVVPGDRVELEVSVLQRRGDAWRVRGVATVDGQPCAEAELLTSRAPAVA